MCERIQYYFPSLSEKQYDQFSDLLELYPLWNEKINVISRKDISNLEINHILHSLAIAKYLKFKDGSKVLDFGTGGGLPGIPLAVMFPHVHFHLIDRIGKKIKVASAIAEEIGLKNVTFQHGDSSECKEKFDFIVSRAVMPQMDLVKLSKKNISEKHQNALPNGIITLKGGDLTAELESINGRTEIIDISNYYSEPFFESKKIVYTSI